MDRIRLGYAPGVIVYTLVFKCPGCGSDAISHDYTHSRKTETDLRVNSYSVKC